MFRVCSCPRIVLSSCTFSRPDGIRGFGFSPRDGIVEADLTVEWRNEVQRRGYSRILQFARHAPSRNYVASMAEFQMPHAFGLIRLAAHDAHHAGVVRSPA